MVAAMKLFATLVLLIGLATTTHADAPAPKPDEATQARIDKFVKFFDALVDIVVAAKDDCDKAAVGINAHADANKEVIAAAIEAKAAGKKLPQSIVDHLTAGLQKMTPTLKKCISNAKFKTALDRVRPNEGKGK
jgi:hypothetical protein